MNTSINQRGVQALSLAALMGCFTFNAQSASIDHGDFAADTVNYLGVIESSITDPVPLFGAPTVSGNTLDFDPKGFAADSQGVAPPDITDGQLNFTIQALDGYGIPALTFSERGDFTLAGIGTANTYASVAAAFFVDIVDVDGVALPTPIQLNANMVFTPNASGKFELPTDEGSGVIWTGDLNLDLNAALVGNAVAFDLGATLVKVSMDNTLVAQSEEASRAFIAKKDVKGFSVTSALIPEPTSTALILLGSLLLAPALRRRS